MGMMEKMMEYMMGRMSKEDKDEMMEKMMDKFFADMTAADKQKMMAEMMPKMMMGMMGGGESEGCPMGKVSEMMAGGEGMGMSMMPKMMTEMMPHCLTMMLPSVPKEARVNFVLKMVTILVEQGSAGMSDEEKEGFLTRVAEEVKA
jgi:hypothetical protein